MTRCLARSAMVGLCLLTLPALGYAQAFSEGFDDITTLPGADWFMQNNSSPIGLTNWFQGNALVFPAQSGVDTAYMATNYNNVSGANIISNWLLTPNRTFNNGDSLTFYTRTVTNVAFPDRLQVRMSTNGASTNVGTLPTDVGDFGTLLLDINPNYTFTDYPTIWTQFTVVISGLGGPTSGRLAFRYFVDDGGPAGANSDYIGIDTVVYTPITSIGLSCGTPSPSSVVPAHSATITSTVFPAQVPPSTGITVSCDASSVSGGTVTMLDNGVPPDVLAGDHIYTGTVNVGGAVAAGSYNLPTTANDAQGRTATCGISLTVLPIPPSNDDCQNAIAVTCDSSTAGTLAGATIDFPTGGSLLACGNTGDQAEYQDRVGVWYSFVGNGGPMRASTCNAGTAFDTQIAVFEGPCDSLTCVAGNDDAFSACSSSGLRSIVDFNTASGTVYHAMVMPWPTGTNSNTFVFDLICSLPLHVSCNAAQPATVPVGTITLLSAAVTPGTNPPSTGISVKVDLSAIGGSSTQQMYDDGTHGDVSGGDGTYSYAALVPLATAPGAAALPVNVTDNQSRSDTCTINITVAPPPPANDDCSGAIALTCGSIVGVVDSATVDFPTGGSLLACGNTGDQAEYEDRAGVWYTYVGQGQPARVSTCNSVTSFDTQIVVFDGSCGSLNCVGGNDDLFGACSDSGLYSAVTFNAALGVTYHIMVCPWSTFLTSGTFQLDVICALPLDVLCETPNPNPVGVGGATLLSARVSAGTNPVSTGIAAQVDLSSLGGSASQTLFDDGSNGDAVAGDGVYSYLANVPSNSPVGFLSLPVNISDAQGRTASCAISLTVTPPPAQNDDCSQAIVISSLPYSTAFDNSSSTPDGIPGSCNTFSATTMQNSVWFSFTPGASGSYDLSIDNQFGYDAIVVVSEGGCGAQVEVACGDEPEPIEMAVSLNAGTQYLIQIGDWGSFPGGGLTQFTLTSQIAQGACCLGPGSSPPAPPRTCQIMTSGACAAANGRYQGDGSACTPLHACCWGDLDGDFDCDESDLGLLLQAWQHTAGGDLDGDGDTDESDLGLLLQNWQCHLQ
ncbi:MAG: choice-of-anchor J domain-containing protein [Phycisphaerae bacterium]